jgi:signal transduction histidine kinase
MPELAFDPYGGTAAMRRSRALVRLPATLPGAILAAGLAATVVLIALAHVDAFGNRAIWAHAHWNLSALSATFALAVASVRASGRDRIVRAGTLCALILWSIYTALWTIQVAIGRATVPSPADVFALGIIVPAAVVVVATVHGRLSRAEEAAVYLDSALIAAAILAVLLVLFGPAAYAVGGLGSVLAFVFPLEFLAIAGAGAVALVAIRHPIRLRGGFPLLAGSAITGIAYLGWLAPAAFGQEVSDQLPSPLFSIGTLLVGFGAATWTDETATGPRYQAATEWLSRVVGPAAASITLLGLLRDSTGLDALEPAIHMTVVAAGVLFVIRQGLLLRERSHTLREIRTLHDENDRLVDELRAELIERKRVQDRLVDASRMAAVGELAAGVAHEVNNPLTGVLGFSELLLEDMTPEDPRRGDVESIRSEAIRARSIIRALRDFARPRVPQPLPTDLPDLVARTLDLLRYPLERAGVIISESYAEMPPIDLDPQAIQQVVLNVLTNAMQAMPDGGTLEVETVVRGDQAVMTVVDNGVGMDESVAAQAFVPFFSARRASGATGLGLSVSLGLVESHRGSIRLNSRPGEGTTVEISLPIDSPRDAGAAVPARAGAIGE